MDCGPPGSSVCGILQARVLEWVAMPSSRGPFQPRGQIHNSCGSYIKGELNCWATWKTLIPLSVSLSLSLSLSLSVCLSVSLSLSLSLYIYIYIYLPLYHVAYRERLVTVKMQRDTKAAGREGQGRKIPNSWGNSPSPPEYPEEKSRAELEQQLPKGEQGFPQRPDFLWFIIGLFPLCPMCILHNLDFNSSSPFLILT